MKNLSSKSSIICLTPGRLPIYLLLSLTFLVFVVSCSSGGADIDDDSYREAVMAYAQEVIYKDMSEEDVYADVIKQNMHFRYVAFMEIFPNNKHNKEIKKKLKRFNVFTPPQNERFVPLDTLDPKFNFDESNGLGVYLWRDNPVAEKSLNMIRFDHNGRRVFEFEGPVCWGNLQFLDGGFKVKARKGVVGLELSPTTKIIYPLDLPKKS